MILRDEERLINFVIIENINYDLVLGRDELDRPEMIIDYSNGQLQIGKEGFKYENRKIDNTNDINNDIEIYNIGNKKCIEINVLNM